MRKIDHLVYCVPHLETAMDEFEKSTGVRPVFGGYHTTQGTKNALVGLGNQCYLELLAIDEDNKEISAPRWMGIDFVRQSKFTRWALHSSNLAGEAQVLGQYRTELGQVTGGQRKTAAADLLKWQLTLPAARPEVEVVPFLIDWSASDVHPADKLGRECSLLSVELYHPEPSLVQLTLQELDVQVKVNKAAKATIKITLDTPNGVVVW